MNSEDTRLIVSAAPSLQRWRGFAGRICLVLAIILTCLSFLDSRVDSLRELAVLRIVNFSVIGPLWAAVALLRLHGKKRVLLAILALIIPGSALSLTQWGITCLRFTPSRQASTLQGIRFTALRIQAYMAKHRQAPPDLSVLPNESDGSMLTADGWGHEFQYSIDREGVITLTSFGADGKPGGGDRDADIVVHYRTRNADGSLNIDEELWASKAQTGVWIGNTRVDR